MLNLKSNSYLYNRKLQIFEYSTTKTTQSRSTATPKASPDSLSTAPARTNTANQGWKRRKGVAVAWKLWA